MAPVQWGHLPRRPTSASSVMTCLLQIGQLKMIDMGRAPGNGWLRSLVSASRGQIRRAFARVRGPLRFSATPMTAARWFASGLGKLPAACRPGTCLDGQPTGQRWPGSSCRLGIRRRWAWVSSRSGNPYSLQGSGPKRRRTQGAGISWLARCSDCIGSVSSNERKKNRAEAVWEQLKGPIGPRFPRQGATHRHPDSHTLEQRRRNE
jgi:hypothetical protein